MIGGKGADERGHGHLKEQYVRLGPANLRESARSVPGLTDDLHVDLVPERLYWGEPEKLVMNHNDYSHDLLFVHDRATLPAPELLEVDPVLLSARRAVR